MENKLHLLYPVVVEGKYDRLRILAVADGRVYTTDGFSLFNKKEKLSVLRAISAKTPIIVLTDSDGAGKLIRSHITSALPKEKIIQLYIPQIKGKERRKVSPSKEGTLGVEGMETKLLYDLLLPFSVEGGTDGDKTGGSPAYTRALENPLSKVDFFVDGLSGGEDSASKRDILAARFGLPSGMTANALISALKLIASYEEYLEAVERNGKN